MNKFKVLVICIVGFFLAACGGGSNDGPVAYAVIDQGVYSIRPDPLNSADPSDLGGEFDRTARFFTFNNAASFTAWLKKIAPPSSSTPAPTVDFSQKTIASVYLGFRQNGGYSLKITSVAQVGDRIEVSYQEMVPHDSGGTQAAVYPFKMIVIDRPNANVVYVDGGKVVW